MTVTGGPGTSGIAAADGYTAAFDPRIVEDYDIVFLDQRGIGRSRALQCPDAALAFYAFPGDPAQTRSQGLRLRRRGEALRPGLRRRDRGLPEPAPLLLDPPGRRGPRGVPGLARRARRSTCTARATGPSTRRRTRPRTRTASALSTSTARSTSRSPDFQYYAEDARRLRHGPVDDAGHLLRHAGVSVGRRRPRRAGAVRRACPPAPRGAADLLVRHGRTVES